MDNDTLVDTAQAPTEVPANIEQPDSDLVSSDLLIEDVSIDGMCGVY